MSAKTFLYYHVILTTKYRRPTLRSATVRARVAAALAQQAELHDGYLLAVNPGPDNAHVHALVIIPPQHALASYLRDVKSQSGRLANAILGSSGRPFWGRRYFARTVGGGSLEAARRYVVEQWGAELGEDRALFE